MREDLGVDWNDAAQGRRVIAGGDPGVPLHDLDHPLVRHVAGRFAGDTSDQEQVARESISATQDPPFYKAKTGRWRGAVWVDPSGGQAWLCAAGWRYEDEPTKDFYSTFPAMVAENEQKFLPTADDRDLLDFDIADRIFADWEYAATVSVIKAVGNFDDQPINVQLPPLPGHQMPALSVEVVSLPPEEAEGSCPHDLPAEVAIQLVISDWSDPDLLRRIQCVVCSAISPAEDSWDLAPGISPSLRLMATIDEARLQQLRVAARLDSGPPAEVEQIVGVMIAGTSSHWAPVSGLAKAMVEGLAVRGLCGAWFVPRRDHAGLPVCDHCHEAYDQMPA